jgi:hypothetical protein
MPRRSASIRAARRARLYWRHGAFDSPHGYVEAFCQRILTARCRLVRPAIPAGRSCHTLKIFPCKFTTHYGTPRRARKSLRLRNRAARTLRRSSPPAIAAAAHWPEGKIQRATTAAAALLDGA